MHAAALDWTKILVALIGLTGIVLGALIGLIQTREGTTVLRSHS